MIQFELWGYPGCGKSSVSRLLQDRGFVHSLSYKDIKRSVSGGSNPFASWLPNVKLFGLAGTKAKRAVKQAIVRQQNARVLIPAPSLIEEGVIHEVWRQLYRAPGMITQQWWRIAISEVADAVIVLHVGAHIARQRIHLKSNLGPINQELSLAKLTDPPWLRAQAAYDAITTQIMNCKQRKVYWLNTEALDVKDVAIWIENLAESVNESDSHDMAAFPHGQKA